MAERGLAVRHRGDVTTPLRFQFTSAQVSLIRSTVARDCNEQELLMFLEVAARYQLDPFAGQIWAAKIGSRNGGGGRVAIFVGRDGFLTVADRTGEFGGMDSDVVRANDEFSVSRVNGAPVVVHSYKGSHIDRGDIVGGWALVTRAGRTPVFFYAPLEEYKPTSEKKLEYSPWSSQQSAMIVKCAEATALRKAFQITGLYAPEEIPHLSRGSAETKGAEIDWGEDPELGFYLQALFAQANVVEPSSFLPAKVQFMLADKSQDEREAVAREIEEFITGKGGKLPSRGEVIDSDASEE